MARASARSTTTGLRLDAAQEGDDAVAARIGGLQRAPVAIDDERFGARGSSGGVLGVRVHGPIFPTGSDTHLAAEPELATHGASGRGAHVNDQ
jgi:hypothetical protein